MDWLSKIIEKFVNRFFEQKPVPKYLSGIKNLVKANHNEDVKRSKDLSVTLCFLLFLCSLSEAFQLQNL